MKLLIAGNSQASCLKMALDANPTLLPNWDVSFYVVPGGGGPYFYLQDGLIKVFSWGFNPKAPPRQHPDGTNLVPITSYDAILVSALGYIDGGFKFSNNITRQGLIHAFGPKSNEYTDVPISKSVAYKAVHAMLGKQPGFQFLKKLRQQYAGNLILQPYPFLSEKIVECPEWGLFKMYREPVAANVFFSESRDSYVSEVASSLSINLLGRPEKTIADNCFTIARYITDSDMAHPLIPYGRLVIDKLKEFLY